MRTKKCAYLNCTNDSKKDSNLKFFNFPKSADLSRKWAVSTGNPHLITLQCNTLAKAYNLCEEHFDKSQIAGGSSPDTLRLIKGALPICHDTDLVDNFIIRTDWIPMKKSENVILTSSDGVLFTEDGVIVDDNYVEVETEDNYENIYENEQISKPVKIEVIDQSKTSPKKSIGIQIGTQTENTDHVSPFSVFCCTFRNNNEVETYCDLSSEKIDPISPININKNVPEYVLSPLKVKKQITPVKIELPQKRKSVQESPNKKKKKKGLLNDRIIETRDDAGCVIIEFSHFNKEENSENPTWPIKSPKMPNEKLKRRIIADSIKDPLDNDCVFDEYIAKDSIPEELKDEGICLICKTVGDKLLCHRFAVHTDRLILCKFCKMKLDDLELLKTHIDNEHPKELNRYCCLLCDIKLYTEKRYLDHTKLQRCKLCQENFKCKEKFNSHRSLVHKEFPTVYYDCPNCQNSFTKEFKFNLHIKPINCNMCDIQFVCRTMFRNHRYFDHCKFKCHLCSKRFAWKSLLDAHLIRHKNNSLRVRNANRYCDICDKTFKHRPVYEAHMRTHTGEKPFMCHTCGVTFAHKGSLYTHVNGVHGVYKKFVNDDGTTEVRLVKRRVKRFKMDTKDGVPRKSEVVYTV